MTIQLVLDEPRLDLRPLPFGVDLEHPVHVAGEVEDERAIDGLAGERGPAAAREERHLLPSRDLHGRLDVVGVARDHDTDRLDLVHGRVGGVEQTGDPIEANVAGDDLAKFVLEVVHASYYTLVVVRTLPVLLLLVCVVAPLAAAPAAPGFTVRLLGSQRTVDSRDLIGKKVLVLRFQASWCKPCARESAALARVAEHYRARGVEVLAVHVQDTTVDVQRFVREQKVTYDVALDPRLTIANHFGFKGTPYTVVVNRRGEMVAQIHGASGVRRLPRLLDGLLGKAS